MTTLFTLTQVCYWLNRKNTFTKDLSFTSVSIDTRTLKPNALFIALKGPNFDGHDFIEEAIKCGATAIVCSKKSCLPIPQVVVTNSEQALLTLATQYRRQCSHNTLIALSGSCGKTTSKEMLGNILALWKPTTITPANQNNHLGVALQLLRVTKKDVFSVVECGTNHFGELSTISACAQPDVAMLIMSAPAHTEHFGDQNGVIRAKGELFEHLKADGIKIIPQNDQGTTYWQTHHQRPKTFLFSTEPGLAPYKAESVTRKLDGCYQFIIKTPHDSIPVTLKSLGEHLIHNALAVACVAHQLGCPNQFIQQGLAQYQPLPGRLSLFKLNNDSLLIDDSYNANPQSCLAALQVLASFSGTRIAILGPMAELGSATDSHYLDIGINLNQLGIEWLITLGKETQLIHTHYHGNKKHFNDHCNLAPMITFLKSLLTNNSKILIKGSRSIRMERIRALIELEKQPVI
jgi:UDP-N-acetylmuramoyl-tripeptide--D-alanyl-D-alanine ligase